MHQLVCSPRPFREDHILLDKMQLQIQIISRDEIYFRPLIPLFRVTFCAVGIAFFCASTAFADSVEYSVTINTSFPAGTAGALDFNFNPGPLVTQGGDLQILTFSSDGSLQNCAANVQGFCNTGDVSGTLPGTLTFDNGTAFNDYFNGFTFGNSLSFDVTLYGPALTTPNGTATSGSTFAFSLGVTLFAMRQGRRAEKA